MPVMNRETYSNVDVIIREDEGSVRDGELRVRHVDVCP